MQTRYRALNIISTIYKVLGGIIGVITLLLVLVICASSVLGGAAIDSLGREFGNGGGSGLLGGVFGGLLLSLVTILYGGLIAVTLFAIGEAIDLLLALEENTRMTAEILRGQLNKP
ncbi:MAG: hypothetical protein ACE5M4_08250 [Anaerolineales bacterium]